MLRRGLALLLAIACSVQAPAIARAAPVDDVDARAEALYNQKKYLESGQLQEEALDTLAESPETRVQRNTWAIGAVNAYRQAFAADASLCTAVSDGLRVADRYLARLTVEYGEQAKGSEEYAGMQRLRTELADREWHACLAVKAAPAKPVGPTSAPSGTQPAATPVGPSDDGAPKPAAALIAGVGVSAALALALTIGSAVTYTQLRKPDGKYYRAIRHAAEDAEIPTDMNTDMCVAGKDVTAVAGACATWQARERVFIATAVMAGLFAVSTAVFTGLLIRKRSARRSAAAWHRHDVHVGAVPHLPHLSRGGGASLTAGFRF